MTAQRQEEESNAGGWVGVGGLGQLGRKGEERKGPFASAATACVSIAHRAIPVLNFSSSKSAHNLFSALKRRHTTICLAEKKEHFSWERTHCRAGGREE